MKSQMKARRLHGAQNVKETEPIAPRMSEFVGLVMNGHIGDGGIITVGHLIATMCASKELLSNRDEITDLVTPGTKPDGWIGNLHKFPKLGTLFAKFTGSIVVSCVGDSNLRELKLVAPASVVLNGIHHFKRLRSLTIDSKYVTTSVIEKIDSLTRLELSSSSSDKLSVDWKAISTLPILKILKLTNVSAVDCAMIGKLKSLLTLSILDSARITKTAPLSGLTRMTSIAMCGASTMGFVEKLPIKEMNITGSMINRMKDAPLNKLTKLCFVWADFTDGIDRTRLKIAKMTNLVVFDANLAIGSNIDVFKLLPALKTLRIAAIYMTVQDKVLDTVEDLSVPMRGIHTYFADVFPSLKRLHLSGYDEGQMHRVKELSALTELRIDSDRHIPGHVFPIQFTTLTNLAKLELCNLGFKGAVPESYEVAVSPISKVLWGGLLEW
jgi:hypothetical protein